MVVVNPEDQGREAVIKGTRIPVYLVASMLDQGASPAEIVENYPTLDEDKVELARVYARATPSTGATAQASVALKFLIDECAAVPLVALANERGFEACYGPHGDWGSKDHELLPVLLEGELILVTNNGPDFTALLGKPGVLHPGLVILVTQVRAHRSGRDVPRGPRLPRRPRGSRERVVEVDVDDATKAALQPRDQARSKDEWLLIAASVKPVIREHDLPS